MDSVFRFVKKVGHEARSNFPEVLTNLSLPNFGLPTLQLGNRKIQLVKQLGEGGFAFVFLGKDVETQQQFAVKRMIASDRDDMKKIQDEIDSMQKVQHKNIVTLVGTTTIKSPQGRTEVYLVLEFCEGGSLYSILDQRFKNYFTEAQILNIFSDVCEAVFALHNLDPPICHRDIKVENVLLTRNTFKLCDFGSCTTKTYFPQTSSEMNRAEDDINRNTTMSYRSPEMLDLYRHQLINEKADIWALGILLYRICFFKHPFDETSRIAALNVKYEIPEDSPYSTNIHNLIKFMIEPDPEVRPNIGQVLQKVFELRGLECPCDLRPFLDPAAQQTQKQRSIELSKAAPIVSNPLAAAFEWQGGSAGSSASSVSSSSAYGSASGSASAAPVIVNPRRLSGGAPADANSLFFSSPGVSSQPAVPLTNSGGLTGSQDLSASTPAASTPAASFDFFAEATSFSQPPAAVSSITAPSNPDDFFSMFAAPAASPSPAAAAPSPSPSIQKPIATPVTPVSVQTPSPVAAPSPMNRSGSLDFLTASGSASPVPQPQIQPQIFPVSPTPSPLSSSNGAAKPGSLVDMLFAQPQTTPAPLSPFTNFSQPQAGPSFVSPTPSYQVPLVFSPSASVVPNPSHQQAFSQIASAAGPTTTNSAPRRPGADPFKNLNWQ